MLTVFLVDSLADTVADDGVTTLREALQAANTNTALWGGAVPAGSPTETDVIRFAESLFTDGENPAPGTITLGGTQLQITDTAGVTIEGPGSELLTIDGDELSRVLSVGDGAVASLSGVAITGGMATDGGGIYCAGQLSLLDTSIEGNSATSSGGGIYGFQPYGSEIAITITKSSLSANSAKSGGAIFIQGQSAGSSLLVITDSTVSDNVAEFDGGGIHALRGITSVVNSMIVDNSANAGGGVYCHQGWPSLTNTTILGNQANQGGGIYLRDGTMPVANSVIASNAATSNGPDVAFDNGSFTGSSHNLIGIWSEATLPGPNTIWGTIAAPVFPMMTTVTDPDGNLLYCRPNPGSPAINTGSDARAKDADGNPLTVDLLGNPRFVDGTVDMGAVEFNSGTPELVVTRTPGLQIVEGESATIDIWLSAPPASPVTVAIEREPGGSEGVVCNKEFITFYATNWNIPQTVTLLAIDDSDIEEDEFARFAFTSAGMVPIYLGVSVIENDFRVYVVNSLEDTIAVDGVVTLREALEAANTNMPVGDCLAGIDHLTDVIRFAESLFTDGENPVPGTITLGGTQLEITDTAGVTIEGPGAELLTIDADGKSRVFKVSTGAVASITKVAMTNGSGTDAAGIDNYGNLTITAAFVVNNSGRGIHCSDGVLTVTGTTIAGNSEGGITSGDSIVTIRDSNVSNNFAYYGGGIRSEHDSLTIANSVFEHNTGGGGVYLAATTASIADSLISSNIGGGIKSESSSHVTISGSTITHNVGGGGIANNHGNLIVTGTIVSGNSAQHGAGICCEGSQYGSSSTFVADSIITDNRAMHGGGGIWTYYQGDFTLMNSTVANNEGGWGGGGIYCGSDRLLNIINSTVAGNSGTYCGGGIYSWFGVIDIVNSTVVYNSIGDDHGSVGEGGGLHCESGQLTLVNSIIALNKALEDDNVHGSLQAGSANNLIDGTPEFTAIANEDGVVLYYRPRPGNPAIDAGDNTLAVAADGFPLTLDIARNARIVNSTVDIGAVEFLKTPELVVTPTPTIEIAEGQSEVVYVSLSVAPYAAVTVTIDKRIGGSDDITSDLTTLEFDPANWNVPQAITFSAAPDPGADLDVASFGISCSGMDTVWISVIAADDDPQIYVVNSLLDIVADDGVLTLREALEAANTNKPVFDAPAGSRGASDIITFAPHLFTNGETPTPQSLVLGGDELQLLDNIVIEGPGAGLLVIDAKKKSRVFSVGADTTAWVSGVTVTGGLLHDSGGGFYNSGILTVVDSVVRGNVSEFADGGGIYNTGVLNLVRTIVAGNAADENGGAIYNLGSATITDSVLDANSSNHGGAVYMQSATLTINGTVLSNHSIAGSGAAIYNFGASTVTINDSVVRDNRGGNGGAIYNWGESTVSLAAVVIGGNQVSNNGGGIFNRYGRVIVKDTMFDHNQAKWGGAIYSIDGSLSVANSTFTQNGATAGGGAICSSNDSVGSVTNSTIVENLAGQGGGIHSINGTMTVNNSIVAMNHATSNPDITPTISSLSDHNIIGVWDDATTPGNNSVWGTFAAPLDPILVTITQANGDILYFRPHPDSPAVNAGSDVLAVDGEGNPLTTDFLGGPRIVGSAVDVGAVELGTTPELAVTSTPSMVLREGEAITVEVMLTAMPGGPVTVIIGKDEGGSDDITVDHTSLMFDVTNWNIPQTVMIVAVEDLEADNDVATFTFLAEGMQTVRIAVTTVDNDPQVFVVDSVDDIVALDGKVTLREAIEAANTNMTVGDAPAGSANYIDIITFSAELSGRTIVLSGEQLTITADLEIRGLGASELTIDADGLSRVFYIAPQTDVTISGLTITGGSAQYSAGDQESKNGGGVYIENLALLTMADCHVAHNTAEANGGGVFIRYDGTFSLADSTVEANRAGATGGAIGATYTYEMLLITNSVLSGNSAERSGGVFCRGRETRILGSTISNNSALQYGGGIEIHSDVTVMDTIITRNTAETGGGLFNYGTLTLVNSIVAQNTARDSGGGVDSRSTLTVTNSTIANNVVTSDTGSGGGIYRYGTSGTVTIANSVISLNEASSGPDLFGTFPAPSSSLIGVDPQLVAVVDDEGVVLYYRPHPNSPAINAGDNSLAVDRQGNPLINDILGNSRILGGAVDIGATEFTDAIELAITSTPAVTLIEGNSLGIEVMLTAAPSETVVITVAKRDGDSNDITADATTVEFDASNWSSPQLVTFTAHHDDDIANDDLAVFSFSAAGMEALRIWVNVIDDDTRTYVVDSLADVVADDGLLTLREAIEAANTNADVFDAPAGSLNYPDIITFAPNLAGGTIVLSGTHLEVRGDLQIEGLGASQLVIDANQLSRVFHVGSGVTASIEGLTVTGGWPKDIDNTTDRDTSGGGIYNAGALTISNCSVEGNISRIGSSYKSGGGIYNDAGTLNIVGSTITNNRAESGSGILLNGGGTLNITNSTISNNIGLFGGLFSDSVSIWTMVDCTVSDNVGMGIYTSGTASIISSTVSGNTAGGIYNSGGQYGNHGILSIYNSMVSSNSATGRGGGICSYGGKLTIVGTSIVSNSAQDSGGGVFSYNGASVHVANSTIANNSAASYGGGFYQKNNGTLTIVNSTLADNTAGVNGGGIYNSNTALVFVMNSILASNSAPNGTDFGYDTTSLADGSDFNLIGVWSDTAAPGANSIWGTPEVPLDPKLTMITDPDGMTLYYRLNPDSPAVNAGSNARALDADGNPLDTDMRGKVRIYRGIVDMGAIEAVPELAVAPTPEARMVEGDFLPVEVFLTAPPTATMVVSFGRYPGGGGASTVLLFNPTNWNVPQTVMIAALEDDDIDDETATFYFSADGMDTVYLTVFVADNDARTYVVDSLEDTVAVDGKLTLREAIEAANTNTAVGDAPAGGSNHPDIITFAPGLLGGTIVLSGSQLTISEDLVIQGLGADLLAIDADGRSRIFLVDQNVACTIADLTISGGSATTGGAVQVTTNAVLNLVNMVLSNNAASASGGALYCLGGTVSIIDSNVEANSALNGGGVYNQQGSLTITGSTFDGNSSLTLGGGVSNKQGALTIANSTFTANTSNSFGGAIHNEPNSTTTVTGSTFSDNSTRNRGGAVYNLGALTVDDSTFINNSATASGSYGGAVGNYNGATAKITGSTFHGNHAVYGGAVFGYQNTAVVVANSAFSGNYARTSGGGLFSHGASTLTVVNSTIAGNAAGSNGGGIYSYTNCQLTLQNSIVAINRAASLPDILGSLTAASSHNQVGGEPRFVRNPDDGGDGWHDNPATLDFDESTNNDYGDLRLRFNSPAINAGSNALAVAPDGSPLTVDVAGQPRIVYDVVDLGAHEFQAVTLLGDANGDNAVNELDAAILASNWGRSGMTWADGDFNNDGRVNAIDAAILAAHFGTAFTPPAGEATAAEAATATQTPSTAAAPLVGPLPDGDSFPFRQPIEPARRTTGVGTSPGGADGVLMRTRLVPPIETVPRTVLETVQADQQRAHAPRSPEAIDAVLGEVYGTMCEEAVLFGRRAAGTSIVARRTGQSRPDGNEPH